MISSNKKTFTVKNSCLTVLACLILPLQYGCDLINQDEDIHTLLENTSDAMNRNLPDMVSQDMLLLETSYEDMEYSYYVSVLNYSVGRVDVDAFVEFMHPILINDVCESERHIRFINEDVSIRYVYSDKDQQEFTTITIRPNDCSQ